MPTSKSRLKRLAIQGKPKKCERCDIALDGHAKCEAINCPSAVPTPEIIQKPHYRCGNCGAEYPEDIDFGPEITHFWERIEEGGMVPAGECPQCEALCYPIAALLHVEYPQEACAFIAEKLNHGKVVGIEAVCAAVDAWNKKVEKQYG